MSTYLVTGAAGFIASKVCEFLLADGHTVVGVDNLNDYYDVRLKDYRLSQLLGRQYELTDDPKRSVYANNSELIANSSKLSALSFQRFHFYHLDIENLAALESLFAEFKFDAVFNLAARAGVRYSMENPHVYMTTNAHGTLNLLECMRKYGVKKQVLASTSSLYAGCPMPFTEDQPVNTPLSPYAASKKAAEAMAYSYHHLYGIDVSVVRYFTVYGPAGRPDMAPYRFVHWIATGHPIALFGDGSATRDFTYVDDIARGTILAGQLFGSQLSGLSSRVSSPSYEIINLGGGNRPIAINAMIELIENYLGKKAVIDRKPANPVDMTDTQADIGKAGRLLGWQPQVTPEQGFHNTVKWYRENQEWLAHVMV